MNICPNMWWNLYRVLGMATPEDIDMGRKWYYNAHVWAKNVAEKHGLDLAKVVDVTAALSQNNKWENNIIDTERVLTAWRYGIEDPKLIRATTYHKAVYNALDILNGVGAPEGAKIECFAHNMMYPDLDDDVVTIDQWAWRAWVWDSDAHKFLSRNLIKRISEDYVWLARQQGYVPHELQAIIWLVIRRSRKLGGVDAMWKQTRLL